MPKTYADHNIMIPPGRNTGEVYTLCPNCSQQRNKKNIKCLSVNVDKGTWYCHHCGWTGGLPMNTQDNQFTPAPAKSLYVPPKEDELRELTTSALDWLESRGISHETALELHLRTMYRRFNGADSKTEECIAIPFLKNGKPVNWKYRAIGAKVFGQSKGGEQCV